MRAHPATNFLTPDQIRDPLGVDRKIAAPRDLETPRGDLTATSRYEATIRCLLTRV